MAGWQRMMRTKLRQALSEPRIAALLGILSVALALRLWGIGFGLPYEYHVDEVQYVRQAAAMGARGLEPVWWNNPPFFKYILFAEYAGLFVLGKLLGWYSSAVEFGARHSLDPTWLYLLGRATSAVFGALTALVAIGWGRWRTIAAWVCFLPGFWPSFSSMCGILTMPSMTQHLHSLLLSSCLLLSRSLSPVLSDGT